MSGKEQTESNKQTRCLSFEVYLKVEAKTNAEMDADALKRAEKEAKDAAWKQLRELFTVYRQTVRGASAVLEMAATAGAEVREHKGELKILDNSQRCQDILALAFGKEGKRLGYPMRDWILERFGGLLRSDFADSALRDVASRWTAKDAEFKARRAFLVLAGARRPALMAHVPLPIRTRGKTLVVAENGHGLTFRPAVDVEIQLAIGDMDPSRWATWRRILDGGLHMCDPVFLHNNDGKLKLRVPYTFEAKPMVFNAARVLEVAFTPDPAEFIRFRVREGHDSITDLKRGDNLSALGAIEGLDAVAARAAKLSGVRGPDGKLVEPGLVQSCGWKRERREGSGCAPALERYRRIQNGLTAQRQRFAGHWNHFWSARTRIIAERWECGAVMVFGPPATLLARSWPWADFRGKLEYKLGEIGAKVEWVEPVKLDSAVDGLCKPTTAQ